MISRTLRCALALLLCTAGLIAQSRNVTLLSTARPPNDSFNDIWGYVDQATGREYAMLLSVAGTYIYNATDPRQPVLRSYIAASRSGWGNSTWRCARTYGHYLYVVTESGSGMQIIDLADPENPVLVRTFNSSNWGHSHNIAIDLQTGLCYPCGTSGGTLVFDLAANPTNPPLVARYAAEYVHDLQMLDGYGYLAEVSRGRFRVVDLRNLPTITSLGVVSVPVCHNTWPTRDGKFCVATSETSGPGMTIIDVRNKSNPQMIQSWTLGGVIHNAQVDDRLVHISYYSSGYRCVDLSDPWNPVEVGYYDSGTDWGVYGFQPSGVVYASDRSLGLEILKPKGSATDYGTGSAGTGGTAPTLHTFGSGYLGNPVFGLEADDGVPNANAYFFVGTRRQNLNVLGLRILVETLTAPALFFSTTTDANGQAKQTIPVPSDASLDGVVLHAQGLIADPNGPLGFSATAGKTFELFAR